MRQRNDVDASTPARNFERLTNLLDQRARRQKLLDREPPDRTGHVSERGTLQEGVADDLGKIDDAAHGVVRG